MRDEPTTLQAGFRVQGRVQGVGFRWWTHRVATGLGLRGVVMNRGDGSVEVHASGEAESVDRLEDRLSEGPSGAVVDAVERVPSDRPLPAEFRIISGHEFS